MSSGERSLTAGIDRAQEIGLFRYALIRQAADPGLSPRERGALVRALAQAEHIGPFGARVRVSRVTLDRWIRAYRAGGFAALVPAPRRRHRNGLAPPRVSIAVAFGRNFM